MAVLNIDTDIIKDRMQLAAMIAELCEPHGECLLFPHYTITVNLRGYRKRIGISVARVAWALANPHDHLGVQDVAVHICTFGTQATLEEPRACCTPHHIQKGTHRDAAVMRAVRARDLVLRGGHS